MHSTQSSIDATHAAARLRQRTAIVLIALSACYAGVFASLARHWASNDMYAHGFLIPFISAYVLWSRRERFAGLAIQPDAFWGWLGLGAGLLALIVGHVGGLQIVEQLSLMPSLAGAVLLLFGREALRAGWFGLFYLLFMMPVWEFATEPLHAPFQQMSAWLGATVLQAGGLPVRLDGVLLELPTVTLRVARECSGVNFLVAIIAIGLPQAYLVLHGTLRRVAALVFGAAVALFSNGLRVALIGYLASRGLTGPDIHGPGHLLQGMFVAGVGFVALFTAVQWLARSRSNAPVETVRTRERALEPRISVSGLQAWAGAIVLVLTAAFTAFYRPVPVEAHTLVPASFAADIGEWRHGAPVPPPSFLSGGADEQVSRLFYGPDGRVAQMYVGYFRFQEQAKELVDYRMAQLHRQATPVRLTLPDGRVIEANELVRPVRDRREYLLFWYDLNGRAVASEYRAKAWTIWGALLRRRTNGAVIAFRAETTQDADVTALARDVRTLAAAAAPVFDSYLPK